MDTKKKIHIFVIVGLIGLTSISISLVSNTKPTYASDVTVDGLIYSINSGTSETITYKVGSANYSFNDANAYATTPSSATSVTIPDTITVNNVNYDVTEIGERAFSKVSISALSIGNKIKKISADAFMEATFTTTASKTITFPYSLTTIEEGAFRDSVNLQNIKSKDSASNVTSNVFPANLTTLGQYAFKDSEISTITIPSSLTNGELENNVFTNSTKLNSVTYATNLKYIGIMCFKDCTSLNTPDFSSLTTSLIIDGAAYYGCNEFSEISLPSQVTYVGEGAFNNCSNLKSIQIESRETSNPITIKDYAFGNNTIASIYCDFENNSSYFNNSSNWNYSDLNIYYKSKFSTTFTVGNNTYTPFTTRSTDSASGLTALSGNNVLLSDVTGDTITVPSAVTNNSVTYNVKEIGPFSYQNNTSVKYLSFDSDSTIDVVRHNAFDGATNLVSNSSSSSTLTFPNTIKKFEPDCLHNCKSITSLTLPYLGTNNSVTTGTTGALGYLFGTTYGSGMTKANQYYSGGSYQGYYLPSGLTTITLTDEVTVPYGSLSNITSLTTVTLNSGVTTINGRAFYGSTGLTTVSLPETLTTINEYAFYGVTALRNNGIVIPSSVTSIGNYAFYNIGSYSYNLNLYMKATSSSGISFGTNYKNSYTNVYYYSATEQSGYWYDNNGTPTLW